MYQTRTTTQTATQAKRLASRIGAELLQVQINYGRPTDPEVNNFILEAEGYLANGYLESVRYGFKREGVVIFELVYSAAEATTVNDKPGRVPVGSDLTRATWFSFLKQNEAWWRLTPAQREAFRESVPIKRSIGNEPQLAPGIRTVGSKQFSEDSLGLRREVRTL